METKFTDTVSIGDSTKRTGDGYLIAQARCVRTGIQLYSRAEVGMVGDGAVRIYRSPDEVFSRDSLQSFSHAPVTIDHPAVGVSAENWRDLAVGEVSTAALPDGQWVQLPLILKDQKAIDALSSGKRELSAGYLCELDMTPGLTADGEAYDGIQKNIRINHLALVDRARAGHEARIGDGASSWGLSPITKKESTTMDKPITTRSVTLDGISIETTDQGAQAIDKLAKQLTTKDAELNTLRADHVSALEAKDTAIGELKAEVAALKADALTPEKLSEKIAERVALETSVKAIVPDLKLDGLSDADVRKAVVASRLGDDALEGASDAEVTGMFKAVMKQKPAAAQSDAARTAFVHNPAPVMADGASAHAAMEARISNGWKRTEKGAA